MDIESVTHIVKNKTIRKQSNVMFEMDSSGFQKNK